MQRNAMEVWWDGENERKRLKENLCVLLCVLHIYVLYSFRSFDAIYLQHFLCISRRTETRRRYKMMHITEFYNKVVKKRIFSDDDQLTQHTHSLTHMRR